MNWSAQWHRTAVSGLFALGCALTSCRSAPEESALEGPTEKAPAPERKAPPSPGDTAPDVKGLSHIGYMVSLSNFRPGPVAVYYCAALDEACEQLATRLRDDWLELTPHLTMALVFSPAGMHENREFATRLELPLLMVSDHSGEFVSQLRPIRTPGAPPAAYLLDGDRKLLSVFDDPWRPSHVHELQSALEKIDQ